MKLASFFVIHGDQSSNLTEISGVAAFQQAHFTGIMIKNDASKFLKDSGTNKLKRSKPTMWLPEASTLKRSPVSSITTFLTKWKPMYTALAVPVVQEPRAKHTVS